ncbi:SdpI family protein [Collinsella tanakaei]|uniref:SdpI family protein n=1 Tax=Collinsella tanakaei TaxID=626935 RepID=UPI0026EAEBA2|nr:SdpI family protein [Collinsella tanakaei]
MMNKQNDTQRSASVKSPVNRRAWIALGALCIVSFLGHLAIFPQLPDIVPTHWDAAGNVDGWSGRMATLGLDLLPLGLLALFYALPKIDPRRKAYERMGSFYTGVVTLFTVFLICMTWTTELTVFGIIPQNESPIGIFTGVTVGIGLMLLGNYLPKVKRNYSFGCKTPWALDNDQNWRLTHRFGGVAMVLAGLMTVVSGLFSRQMGGTAVVLLLAAVIGSSLATYAYSYLVFRNGNKPLRAK